MASVCRGGGAGKKQKEEKKRSPAGPASVDKEHLGAVLVDLLLEEVSVHSRVESHESGTYAQRQHSNTQTRRERVSQSVRLGEQERASNSNNNSPKHAEKVA